MVSLPRRVRVVALRGSRGEVGGAHVLELPQKLRYDPQMHRLWPLQPLCSFLHAAALLTAGSLR